ncbi:MAG: hypothetical protein ACRCUS_04720, partial [Anaerovoracaceae bacterium]
MRKGSNGKFYVDLFVMERKMPDDFGNTHTVIINKDKGVDTPTVYVGNAKKFGGVTPQVNNN